MTVRVRPRRDDDLPILVRLLGEQQPSSAYPVRWPLPFPVEDFLVRAGEERSWVAELDGEVVGHVTVETVTGDLLATFEAATGDRELAMVSVLFTGLGARGHGVGGALLDTAVAWIREQGRLPVLDVVPIHATAVEVYRHRGWVDIGTAVRLDWMSDDVPDLLLMTLPDAPHPAESAH